MIYKYKAFKDMEIINGKVSATNIDEAIFKLKKDGLRPINIKEDIENYSVFKRKFNDKELCLIFKELYFLLNAGVKIDSSFNILKNQFNKEKKKAIELINESLLSGESLSDSFKQTNMFSDFVVNLLSVGENSSNLELIFRKLSEYYFNKLDFRKKIINALSYPILLIFVSIIVVNFLMINVIPSFVDIFSSSNVELPKFTKILIVISSFISKNILFLTLCSLIICLVIFVYFTRNKNKLHKLYLKSKYYKKIYANRFVFNMYLLLSSGLVVEEALSIIIKMQNNLELKNKIKYVLQSLKSGESLVDSFREINIFDEIFLSLVYVGEESSNLVTVFNSLNEFYSEELENYNKRFLELIGPILIIILSIIVGFIVISIALPIFDLVNTIWGVKWKNLERKKDLLF